MPIHIHISICRWLVWLHIAFLLVPVEKHLVIQGSRATTQSPLAQSCKKMTSLFLSRANVWILRASDSNISSRSGSTCFQGWTTTSNPAWTCPASSQHPATLFQRQQSTPAHFASQPACAAMRVKMRKASYDNNLRWCLKWCLAHCQDVRVAWTGGLVWSQKRSNSAWCVVNFTCVVHGEKQPCVATLSDSLATSLDVMSSQSQNHGRRPVKAVAYWRIRSGNICQVFNQMKHHKDTDELPRLEPFLLNFLISNEVFLRNRHRSQRKQCIAIWRQYSRKA